MAHDLTSKNKHIDAVVFGGVNMDIWGCPTGALLPRDSNPGKVSLRPGGVGRNIAHDLRLLGLEVSLVAPIGGDVYSLAILDSCRALGIDLSHAPVFPDRSSSCYLYITDAEGELELAINDMDICALMTPELVSGLLPKIAARALVLDANLPGETLEYICHESSLPLYADPVSGVKAMKLLPLLHKLRALKPNAIEAELLTGEKEPEKAALALVEKGVQRVFLSLGAQGMIAADKKELLRLPAPRIEMVNCTGAGDAATAAIVMADINGLSLRETAQLAQRAGALTCLSHSANAPELSTLAL